ncbi:MAG: LPS export ABC transporter periplasmic protein LptC [Puniceicoccales bacterium]|jgi:hypothetical protein|nr:LPS export ABC transporter periplasmic protein LptC [Puniceicoccales bacterium]
MLPRAPVFYVFFVFTLNLCFSNSLYHFSLPFFNEHGIKICDIFGRQADLSDDKNLKISDINIQNIPKNAIENATEPGYKVSVTSEQAIINPQENIAMGKGLITISSDEFLATGSDWQFSGNSKNFTLNKNVQVFFKKT